MALPTPAPTPRTPFAQGFWPFAKANASPLPKAKTRPCRCFAMAKTRLMVLPTLFPSRTPFARGFWLELHFLEERRAAFVSVLFVVCHGANFSQKLPSLLPVCHDSGPEELDIFGCEELDIFGPKELEIFGSDELDIFGSEERLDTFGSDELLDTLEPEQEAAPAKDIPFASRALQARPNSSCAQGKSNEASTKGA
jgi:hypothetical protein